MSARFYLWVSALSGAVSVALGAFGAHGLKKVVSVDMLATYQPVCSISLSIAWPY